jgi:hypothetical protein
MDLDCLENILNRYGIEMMIKHEPQLVEDDDGNLQKTKTILTIQ